MTTNKIKPGPKATHDFASYEIGHIITIDAIKQSSFKSMVSKFNKGKEDKQQYSYASFGKRIKAVRVK